MRARRPSSIGWRHANESRSFFGVERVVDTSRLKQLAQQLRQKKELETSMRVARKRQLKMLPQPPEIPGYEFKILYIPASSVSGDFYD